MNSNFGQENMRDIASALTSIAASLQNIEKLLQSIDLTQTKKGAGRPKVDWKTTAYIWYRAQGTYMKPYAISRLYGVSETVVRNVMTLVDNPAKVEYTRQTGLEAKGKQWLEWLDRELPDDIKK